MAQDLTSGLSVPAFVTNRVSAFLARFGFNSFFFSGTTSIGFAAEYEAAYAAWLASGSVGNFSWSGYSPPATGIDEWELASLSYDLGEGEAEATTLNLWHGVWYWWARAVSGCHVHLTLHTSL